MLLIIFKNVYIAKEQNVPPYYIFQFPNGLLYNNDFHIWFLGGGAPILTISINPLDFIPLSFDIGPENNSVSFNSIIFPFLLLIELP